MRIQIRLSSSLAVFLLVILVLMMTSCGGGEATTRPPGDGPEAVTETEITQPEEGLPEDLGVVLDPDGNPVPFVIVGGAEMASMEGVFSGTIERSPTGWVTFESAGYATTYAHPFGQRKGVNLYEARMTPFDVFTLLNKGESTELLLGGENSPIMETAISADLFSTQPALIGISPIDAVDIDPAYEPFPAHPDLKLKYGFSIQAFSETHEPIDLAQGKSLILNIDDAGLLTSSAVLAAFNPESGEWENLEDACNRQEPAQWECSLPTLPPLMAWFDVRKESSAREPSGITSNLLAATGQLPVDLAGFLRRLSPQRSGLDDDFQNAHDAIRDWLKSKEDEGTIDIDDPELAELMNDLAEAARNFAGANRNEAGKLHLILAAEAAMLLGFDGLADSLISDATDISNELGRKALNESDCGEFKKLLKAAEQIMLLGGDEALADQLVEKAQEMAEDCDVWAGWIRVIMPSSSNHPAGLPMSGRGGMWLEYHNVQMWTNVDDFVMHGLDKIQLTFSEVRYIKQDECKMEIKMYGNPPSSSQQATFEGRFDGYTFQIGELVPETGGIGIGQSWEFQDKQDGICVTVYTNQFSTQNFVSVIAHGLTYGSPLLTIQEMVDEGTAGATGSWDSISGSEPIVNPDPEMGLYPFTRGTIIWNFIHVQKKLPLEEGG